MHSGNRAKIILIMLILCIALSACMSQAASSQPVYYRYRIMFFGMFDTVVEVLGNARTQEDFNYFTQIIHGRLEELHRLFDIYNQYDGINNLKTININAGIQPVEVSQDIIDLLLLAKEGYQITGGLFNVAMGSVLAIWHDYRDFGRRHPDLAVLPDMDKLLEASLLTNIDDVVIDEENSTVFLRQPGMSLDVGAIAKAFAAEDAAFLARDRGFSSFLLNAGGQIVVVGEPQDTEAVRWGIAIQDPELSIADTRNRIDTIFLNSMSVSSSGGYIRHYIVNDESFGHIIDPRSLMPPTLHRAVTVIHECGSMSDIISTALFMLTIDEGKELLRQTGGDAIWVGMNGELTATDGYVRISQLLGEGSAFD